MILVDTSAWIEWLIGSKTAKLLAAHWPAQQNTLVPTLVQLELAKWLTREISEDAADKAIAYTSLCHVVQLTTRIALLAAGFSASDRKSVV